MNKKEIAVFLQNHPVFSHNRTSQLNQRKVDSLEIALLSVSD